MFATEVAEELPATCIMKLNDSYGADGIIATQDITNIVDLQGKRIAVEKGSPSHFFLLYLLKREGLTPEDVELQYIPTAGDAAAAFAGGNADAAVTWEPYVSETVKQVENAHILTTSKEKFGLLLDVLIVNTDYAGTKPDVVEGVMRAWFDAVEFWQENPDIANAVMAQGLGVSVMDLEAMLSGTQFADYAENQNYFGLTSDSPGQFFEVFEEAQNIWLAEGITAKTVPTESVTDTSFLERMSG
jgi:NitT/TauT family transport system substrate-binding protein